MKTYVQKIIHHAGLGNQMFEWAGGLAASRRLGLPYRWVWQPSGRRPYGLGMFGLPHDPPPTHEVVLEENRVRGSRMVGIACKRVAESDAEFPAVICPFQEEACFAGVADEVRERFTLPAIRPTVPEGSTPVAVHVRRGDYLGHPRLDITGERYFQNAMRKMKDLVPRPHFVVLSDDPGWCSTNLAARNVTVLSGGTEEQDLRTMIGCEAHIISNSTFGWWGAWLGEKGPVIAPTAWHHAPGCYGEWNPVPDRWVRVGGLKPDVKPPLIRSVPFRRTPPTGLPRAIVYPYHAGQAKWQELRYSLRSVAENFEDKDCPVFILGTDRPGWLLYGEQRVVYRNVWGYAEALIEGVQLADQVLWMNDDILMLRPTTWEDCAVPRYVGNIADGFIASSEAPSNSWRAGVLGLFRQLQEWGITDTRMYSTHMPYAWEREKACAVLEKLGDVCDKLSMENLYAHHYPEGSVRRGDEWTQELPLGEAQFLNLVDRFLTDDLKAAIVEKFPNRPAWELDAPFDA